ncbi:YciI family protein [Chengkuizengella sp. SCS-71B]|uniref:YciI family protein n=1 Tax=Chengkuizengella sp. SCS-71B TaxID=3115290 RepID=UPI0032C21727
MSETTSQYIYVLKLIPKLLDESKWTGKENDIVGRHFKALQKLQSEGQLILAGRTQNMDETTFGIVIFKAESENEANLIMENDPAVKEGIMTAKLYPYQVALISESNI